MSESTTAQVDTANEAANGITVGVDAKLPWGKALLLGLQHVLAMDSYMPPFIIATALGLKYLSRHQKKLAVALAAVLGIAAIALFIGFYPLASGVEVPRAWCDAMNWFGGWMWY